MTMIPASFEYLRPKTIPEAIGFLQRHGDDAKILSGGQSLIPMMKFRLARPAYLIDINRSQGFPTSGGGRIPAHRWVDSRGRSRKLAANSREVSHPCSTLRGSSPILKYGTWPPWPAISPMAIRQTIIRQRCWLYALKSWRSGPKGERVLPIDGFFLTLFTTRTGTRRNHYGDSRPCPATPKRWRLSQTRAKGRRLCHRCSRRASDPRREPEHANGPVIGLTNVGRHAHQGGQG